MKFSLALGILFTSIICFGQSKNQKTFVTPITIDKYFKDTFSFTSQWDYPWYIVINDSDMSMENILNRPITKFDTVHQYHTALCSTNHQGEHSVNYCDAFLLNDTIKIVFPPELPAYFGGLSLLVFKKSFQSRFFAVYPFPYLDLSWKIKMQKLILDKESYNLGDTIKGYIEVEFVEFMTRRFHKKAKIKYYFKGYFKTPLLSNEKYSS